MMTRTITFLAVTVLALSIGAAIIRSSWRRRATTNEANPDDWPPLIAPVEMMAALDEHGRVELVVCDFDEPLRGPRHLPPPSRCEDCGVGRVDWRCPGCRLRLCAAHRACPVCERER